MFEETNTCNQPVMDGANWVIDIRVESRMVASVNQSHIMCYTSTIHISRLGLRKKNSRFLLPCLLVNYYTLHGGAEILGRYVTGI